jgi:hypothetical protein
MPTDLCNVSKIIAHGTVTGYAKSWKSIQNEHGVDVCKNKDEIRVTANFQISRIVSSLFYGTFERWIVVHGSFPCRPKVASLLIWRLFKRAIVECYVTRG